MFTVLVCCTSGLSAPELNCVASPLRLLTAQFDSLLVVFDCSAIAWALIKEQLKTSNRLGERNAREPTDWPMVRNEPAHTGHAPTASLSTDFLSEN